MLIVYRSETKNPNLKLPWKSLVITLMECCVSFLYWAEISTMRASFSEYIFIKCSHLMNISRCIELKFGSAIELLANYWWLICWEWITLQEEVKGDEEWASVSRKGKQPHLTAHCIFPLSGHKMCFWKARNLIILSLEKAKQALLFL